MLAQRMIPLAFVSILFGYSSARADDEPALAFNEAVVAANKRLTDGGFEYGKVLAPAFQLKMVDSAELKKKHKDLIRIHTEVVESMKKVKVPDSDEARAFSQAHQRFLAGQKEMVESDLAAIQKIIDDDALDATAKKLKIEGVLESGTERENKAHKELVEAQDAFAKKHNLTIEDDSPEE